MCFFKKRTYLPYRMNRLEYRMASFDNALADLAAKVEAILAVVASDAAQLDAARRAVAEAEARADRVVAEDAAEDAEQDSVRADALNAIAEKLDSVLNPPVEPEAPADPVVVVEVQKSQEGEPSAE